MARDIESGVRRMHALVLLAALALSACTHEDSPTLAPGGGSGFVADVPAGQRGQAAAAGASSERVAELEAQLAAALALGRGSAARLDELRGELAASEEKRVAREREWLEYSSLLGKVAPERLPGGKTFKVDLPQPAPAAGDSDAALPPIDPLIEARSREIARSLAALFTLEQVRGMDLLECGTLDGNAIGPVVFRLLDGQGRLCGGLYANHLRMEASRAARTITLVLEDGYETRAGKKLAFEATAPEEKRPNARRIVLGPVDPSTWANDFHELFGEQGLDLSGDDGLWDLALVKQRLNEQLKTQTAGGTYRLRELGGVQDAALISVHLERADASGKVERRFFADRMRLSRSGTGVEIVLENGMQVRGDDERVPFLDGRYRILLPSADSDAWTRAGLPGLSPPPAPELGRKPGG